MFFLKAFVFVAILAAVVVAFLIWKNNTAKKAAAAAKPVTVAAPTTSQPSAASGSANSSAPTSVGGAATNKPVTPPVVAPVASPVGPIPVLPAPSDPNIPAPAEVTAAATSGDGYPNDTIRSLLPKLKVAHDAVIANGPNPPENAKAWWGARATQAGICASIHLKQFALKLAGNVAEVLIAAAESGDYSTVHGA
jgi:hypothetical protein